MATLHVGKLNKYFSSQNLMAICLLIWGKIVAVAPKITPFQIYPTLRLGERLTLTCAVTKGDPPLTISWTFNDQPVVSGGGGGSSYATALQITAFTSILTVDSLQSSHGGNYSCVVANAAGRASQSQLVDVQGTTRSTCPLTLSISHTHTHTQFHVFG